MIGQHAGKPDAVGVVHVCERHAEVSARLARKRSAAADRGRTIQREQFDLALWAHAEAGATLKQRTPETQVNGGGLERSSRFRPVAAKLRYQDSVDGRRTRCRAPLCDLDSIDYHELDGRAVGNGSRHPPATRPVRLRNRTP